MIENSTVKNGTESVNKDGVKYRHDLYISNYNVAPNWLVNLFNQACMEITGKSYADNSFYFNDMCVSYSRPKFKGGQNGNITLSKLVIL